MTPAPAPAYIEGEGQRLQDQSTSQLLEQLYTRYRAPLLSLCAFWLKDEHLAQDVLHDAILKACESMPQRYNPTKPLWPWLLTIAKRACIDHLRRSLTTLPLEHLASQSFIDPADSTNNLVQHRTEARNLQANLRLLPKRQATALLLRTLEGWSYPSIAAAEAISIKAARQLVVRARSNLRILAS
jgi:RNA polymerase sigma factor (sigma-70 family)